MKNFIAVVLFAITIFPVFGQVRPGDPVLDSIPQEIDLLYREDQFYVALTFNMLNNRPDQVRSKGFSGGFGVGFLRDMPVNARRNIAIAVGAGYSFNKYGENLLVNTGSETGEVFSVIDGDTDYNTNRMVMHQLEVPLEFRWRTSTPESYKFWRVYAGLKLGYVFYYKTTFKGETNIINSNDIDEFNRMLYTAYISFGHNTINFQVQYGLNSFFDKNASLNGKNIDLSAIKLGLIFYIL